jgi:hypothetical protein
MLTFSPKAFCKRFNENPYGRCRASRTSRARQRRKSAPVETGLLWPGVAALIVSVNMKSAPSISIAARGLSALGLFGIGGLAFIVGIVMFFGGLMKDRKSDPDPMLVQILIGAGIGSVLLASSIACFILAVRLLKRIAHAEPPDHNVR